MVNYLESAGISLSYVLSEFNFFFKDSWIVESSASTHICENLHLFDTLHNLKEPYTVILANENNLVVFKVGMVSYPLNIINECVIFTKLSV